MKLLLKKLIGFEIKFDKFTKLINCDLLIAIKS